MHILVLLALACGLFAACGGADVGRPKANAALGLGDLSNLAQVSELHPAAFVLLHEPGLEVQLSALHPAGALFENFGASRESALGAHLRFRKVLTNLGIQTATVREVLLVVEQEKLIEAAMGVLKFELADSGDVGQKERSLVSDDYKKKVLQTLSKNELVDVLVGRPTITLQKSAVNTPLVTLATKFNPVGNLVFTRDQQITTAKGVVLGHLNSPQREAETLIAKLCWEELGVPLVGDVRSSGGGRLEGGDFIPINADVCYIGIGLRTNIEAVEYMMKHDLFGTTRVAVVRDEFDKNQDRMHLDTVFNVIDSKRVIALEDILGKESPKRRLVDVYVKGAEQSYSKGTSGVEFSEFLKEEGWTVVTVTNEQQLNYMINFVNLGRGSPHGFILSVHPDLGLKLKGAGYQGHVEYVDYRGVTTMYGAAHCTTQVLRMSPADFQNIKFSYMTPTMLYDARGTLVHGIAAVGAVALAAVGIRHSRVHRMLFAVHGGS